jgi:YegS/Rv2252/BmrU family lipid kinase
MQNQKPRVLLLINPTASRAKEQVDALIELFSVDARASIEMDKERWTDLLINEGPYCDVIVIGGGDGTISRLLPELLVLKKPFAVLPLGTANDFARTVGLPDDPLAAAKIALSGNLRAIDVGLVNEVPYINVASVGLASKIATTQSTQLKRTWKLLSYGIALLHAVRRFRPFFIDLQVDGEVPWSGPVYQISVANGRFHGGGLSVDDHAAIDDGKLDLYLIYPGRFWQLFACVTHLKFGFKKPRVLEKLSAKRVALQTHRSRIVNADGELATQTPAEFSLLRGALVVLVPA